MYPTKSDGRKSNRRAAFTLVELLVVIGIIAMLISILLPALNKARKSAKTVKCLSTVRQLGSAFTMYTLQHRRAVPFYNDTSEESSIWIGQLRGVYTRIDAHRLCPEASEPYGAKDWARTGTATRAWGPSNFSFIGNQTGSYGINGWLYWYNAPRGTAAKVRGSQWNNAAGWITSAPTYPNLEVDWHKVPGTKDATVVPVFADAIWPDAWPRPDDKMPLDVRLGGYIGSAGISRQGLSSPSGQATHMGRFAVLRHNRGINVVFLDGHAETVPLPQLWALKWGPRWVTPNPLPTTPLPTP